MYLHSIGCPCRCTRCLYLVKTLLFQLHTWLLTRLLSSPSRVSGYCWYFSPVKGEKNHLIAFHFHPVFLFVSEHKAIAVITCSIHICLFKCWNSVDWRSGREGERMSYKEKGETKNEDQVTLECYWCQCNRCSLVIRATFALTHLHPAAVIVYN